MHTKNTLSYKLTAALLLALLLVSSLGGVRSALAAGPDCTLATGTATFDLYAATGSLGLPGGGSIPVWGYSTTDGGVVTVPGPALSVNQCDDVTITLHNNLAVATSLRFEGQALRPDRTGAAPLGTTTYTFTATNAGAFLYEAGPVPGAQYQAAMGMFGALLVRPVDGTYTPIAGQAYAGASTAYTSEALVILSEIDPALNTSASPASFDMRRFKPKYFLINGQAYSDTTSSIGVAAGSSVLLRYVNAGQQAHTMALLGMQQTFLSYAGAELPNYRKGASQLLMPGQSADAIAVIPPAAATGARFALYEAGALLTNNGSQAFGGMLAFLEVGGTPPPPADTLGPAASGLLLSENPTNGLVNVTLSATISDAGRGDAVIQAAEYFIDVTGANGAGIAMSGAFAASTESVSATLLSADLLLLSSGNHTLYIHGQDAAGNWGSFNTIVLNLDKTGPTTTSITFNPAIANTGAVAIQATGNDSASGGGNIAAAEYFIDASPLPDVSVRGAAMTVNGATPIASLTGSISTAGIVALAEGEHTVSIRSQDDQGNWGIFTSATLKVDRTGPATTNVVTTPLATNGTASVRVDALVTDLAANVTNAELFIDNPVAPGAGLGMYAKDGSFNEPAEDVYQTISQVQANALSAGAHTVYVRGKDAAGNWGIAATYTLISDKVKPVASNPGFNPNPVNANDSTTNNTSFNLTFTADGTGSNITQAEWFEGADPGVGKGKQFAAFTAATPINLSTPVNFVALGMTAGNHTINMRAKDAANNWSNLVSVTVNVIYPNAVFADGFESGSFSAWSATSGAANISVVGSPVQAGLSAMAAAINAGVSGYVQDNTPFQDASYHARFYVNPGNLAYTTNGVASTARTIFLGLSPTGGNVFTVQIQRTSTTGSFQVRAQVFRAGGGGGVSTTAWYTIPTVGYTAIEIDWSSATSAAFRFYTAGTLRQTFTGINTSAYKLDTVRLGPQGSWTNVSGTMYFDSFASTRRTLIGP